MSKEVEEIRATNRLLIVVLIIASFFLGSLTNKLSSVDKTNVLGTQQPAQPAAAPKTITNDTIKTWAKEIGLNTTDFNKCFDSGKYKNAISEDEKAGAAAGVSGTPSFFINGTLVVGAQPFDAFRTIIDKEFQQGFAGKVYAQEVTQAPKVSVENGHLPKLGKDGAPVTIIEFSDFECPFCRRYFTETFPQIKKEYVDTGKAAIYYRHFPLSFHPLAQPFALASECANEQGKFWEFHDKIFKEQG